MLLTFIVGNNIRQCFSPLFTQKLCRSFFAWETVYNQHGLNHTYLEFQKAPEIELYNCLMSNKAVGHSVPIQPTYTAHLTHQTRPDHSSESDKPLVDPAITHYFTKQLSKQSCSSHPPISWPSLPPLRWSSSSWQLTLTCMVHLTRLGSLLIRCIAFVPVVTALGRAFMI